MKFLIFYLLLFVSIEANADKLWSGWPASGTYPDAVSCINAAESAWLVSVPYYASCVSFTRSFYSNGAIKSQISGCTSGYLTCTAQGCPTTLVPTGACPTGTTMICSDTCSCSCTAPAPVCEEPQVHPCDMFTGDKAISCKLGVSWDSAVCDWHSASCAEGGPFGGYSSRSPGAGSKLGSTACLAQCLYRVTEEAELEMRIEADGSSCVGDEEPDEVPQETTECLVGTNADWCPDQTTGTNCGYINDEYVCLESIPAGTCVSSPNGAVICVSPPDEVPDTPKPVSPDISDQVNQLGGGAHGTGNTINIYGDETINNGGGIVKCPSGSVYKDGQCQISPGGDGTCPPGYTKYGETLCIYDGNKGGKFAGPGYSIQWELPEVPEYDYSDFMNGKFSEIQSSPILSFMPHCSSGNAGTCPKFKVMGQETDIHCRLVELMIPVFEAYLNLVAALLAARIVLSA
jgi:hypothetical protein